MFKLLDRLLFSVLCLLFLQASQFITLYEQRLGGYVDAQAQQMAAHQKTAEDYYQGDLNKLVEAFIANIEGAVVDTGYTIQSLMDSYEKNQSVYEQMQNNALLENIWLLSTELDMVLAQGVVDSYTPGLPLTTDGWAFGFLSTLLIYGFFMFLSWMIKRGRTARNTKKAKANLKAKGFMPKMPNNQ